MLNALQMQTRKTLRIAVAMVPWLVSMYTLYWLEHGEVWTTETPHRGKLTVAILVIGMAATFLLQSHFAAKAKDRRA